MRLSEVAPGGELVHVVPSSHPFQVERALHEHFAAKRVRGEWFSLSAQDVALLRSLSRADSAADLPDALRSLCLPRAVLSLEAPAGLARAFVRVAGSLGMTQDELFVGLLRAHLAEYERLAEEVRRAAG